jgi:sterol 3beta-glucosyltransferase
LRIAIVSFGSRGDVQPYVALGRGLKHAGHTVRVVTQRDCESLVREYGLDYGAVAGDVRAMMQSEVGQQAINTSPNPMRFGWNAMKLIQPLLRQMAIDCLAACEDSDVLLCFAFFRPFGISLAEKLNIPYAEAAVVPMHPTRAFPSPSLPLSTYRLGGTLNRISQIIASQAFAQVFRPAVNRMRQEVLHLPPWPFWKAAPSRRQQRNLVLYGFSPSVVPRPADWDELIKVTGYWFLDPPASWRPPTALVDFMQAGPAPVYVGFGSMPATSAEETTGLVVSALALAKQRGILLAGWGGLQRADLPDTVLMVDSIPHSWLFPQMAAIVHHGGAGTTAASLRAGVPSILIPFGMDQHFWAQRILDLGVGPPPISRGKLTPSGLAQAILAAVDDQDMRDRAARLGEQIRAEDGIGQAVEAFQPTLRTHPRDSTVCGSMDDRGREIR